MPKIPSKALPIPAASEWVDRPVNVVMEVGSRSTQAKVLGTLAVHPSLNTDDPIGYYVLTHIPSGLRICSLVSKEQAIQLGNAVWSKYRAVFRLLTQEEVVAAMPLEGKEWLKRCYDSKKCVS